MHSCDNSNPNPVSWANKLKSTLSKIAGQLLKTLVHTSKKTLLCTQNITIVNCWHPGGGNKNADIVSCSLTDTRFTKTIIIFEQKINSLSSPYRMTLGRNTNPPP